MVLTPWGPLAVCLTAALRPGDGRSTSDELCDFTNQNVFLGVAFITIRGDAPSTFIADTYLVNSRQNAFDLSYVLLPLHPLPTGFRR